MRRTEGGKAGEDGEPLIGGDLKVDPSTHEVYVGDRAVSLTPADRRAGVVSRLPFFPGRSVFGQAASKTPYPAKLGLGEGHP
jgi:hypothetical protein